MTLLSDLVFYRTYSATKSDGYKESWDEMCDRVQGMHVRKFPQLEEEIKDAFLHVRAKRVVPSMRSAQFAGPAIEKDNARIFNCSYAALTDFKTFADLFYLLLCGTGVGYSVQRHHVNQLPTITSGHKETVIIEDTREGWCDSVVSLLSNPQVQFDYSKIRPEGATISAGGTASGPEPLRIAHEHIRKLLLAAVGRNLSPIAAFDIMNHISDSVVVGGVRRSASICGFDWDDEEMLTAKTGPWWEKNPQRARANISAVVLRSGENWEAQLRSTLAKTFASYSGEPGVVLTQHLDIFTNPCKPLNSWILTDKGYVTFEEALQLESLRVVTPSGDVATATRPFKTGHKEVFKLLLSNGMYLYGTEDHKQQLVDGSWATIGELEKGSRLLRPLRDTTFPVGVQQEEYELGVLLGWLQTDGTEYKKPDGTTKSAILAIGINEFDVVPLLERITGRVSKPHYQKTTTCKILCVPPERLQGHTKHDLAWIRTATPSTKLGFLRAVFTADGSVRNQNNVELYSVTREILEVCCLLLNEFGIHGTICVHGNAKSYVAKDGKQRNNKTTWKLNVPAGQFKRVGMLSKYKQDRLDTHRDVPVYRRTNYMTVVSKESVGAQDVYDITVNHESHAFIDTCVSTHNCGEISLNSHQLCNLTEINAALCQSPREFLQAVKAATLIGTLQASYTNFKYISPKWKEVTDREALLGVSITGQAQNPAIMSSGALLELAADYAVSYNQYIADRIGIKPSARITTVKPSGSTSAVLDTTSGIHAAHSEYYLRRVRLDKSSPIGKYLMENFPVFSPEFGAFLEHDKFIQSNLVVTVPYHMPGAITREAESAVELLERMKHVRRNWIVPGHISGANTHNVSLTVSYKPEEVAEVTEWMVANAAEYVGISLLPYDGGTYVQAPFEECTKETFERYDIPDIDLSKINWTGTIDERQGEAACAAGNCEIK